MSGTRTLAASGHLADAGRSPSGEGGTGRRLIEWIWHVRGEVPLPLGQSADEAMARLASLFDQPGTRHTRAGDTLTFTKQDQAAQDKMSVFDSGVLRVERGAGGGVLRYSLVSRALLFCFFLPLLFLGFAGLTIGLNTLHTPAKTAAAKPVVKKPEVPMNPLDKALGAPAPDKPKKDAKDDKDDAPTPTPAYVFAGIFATLYIVGRILEDRLIRRLFGKTLLGA